MLRKRPALTLSLLALAACPGAMQAQQKPSQVLIERARMLDEQGRHDLAAEDWRQVLLLEPRQPESLAALAAYYRAAGDSTKAQYYERLLDAAHPAASAGVSSQGIGAVDEGGNQSKPDSKLNEAVRLSAAHQYAAALAVYRQVFGNTPPDTWAIAYYETEAAIPAESAQGIAGLRAVAAKYPANPAYQLSLAKVLTYKPATRLEGVKLLAGFRGTPAQNDEARAAWRAALLWDPSSPAALETSRLYLERYPDADLESRLRAAAQKQAAADQITPLEGTAYQALASGNVAEARAGFTRLAGDGVHAGRGELGLGYVSMNEKDFEAAIRHFEAARSKGMRSPALDKALEDARYWSAMSSGNRALQAKDPAAAAAEFARAREVDAHRPEATEALAGSLMAEQNPSQAEAVFAADAKNNPDRPEAWLGWMNALLDAGKPGSLLAIQEKIPAGVRAQLARRPEYLAMLLCAERAQGNSADSRMLLDRIAKVNSAGGDGEVRAAEVLFRHSYFDDASRLCLAALKRDSDDTEAWQTLVQSEHMAGRDRSAINITSRMPHSVDAAAMTNAGFLLALASIYQADGQFARARALLDQAQTLPEAGPQIRIPLEMQRASLSMAQGDTQLAYKTYADVADQAPDNLDAWVGMLSALHAGNRDADALDAMHDLPEAVGNKLRHDAAFLEVAAYIYSGTGHSQEALLCLRAVTDHYVEQHQPVPFAAGIELAWLQLNAGDERPLAATLDRLAKQPGLSLAQSVAIEKVWAAWSMRKAEAALASGDGKQAVAILETAAVTYPGDSALKTQLAGMYVRTGHTSQGMKLYQSMDWNHATVDQFTSGIGAAITAHTMSYAEYWLQLGLQKYPNNVELLRAGAHVKESEGNLKGAENYLKLAMANAPEAGEPGRVASARSDRRSTADEEASAKDQGEPDAVTDSPGSALERMLSGADRSQSPDGLPANREARPAPVDEPTPETTTEMPLNPAGTQEQSEAAAAVAYYLRPAAYQGEEARRSGADTASPSNGEDVGSGSSPRKAPLEGGVGNHRTDRDKDTRTVIADPLQGRDLGLSGAGASGRKAPSSLAALLDSADNLLQESPASDSGRSGSSRPNTLEAQLLDLPRPEASLASPARITAPVAPHAMIVRRSQPVAESPADELAALQARYSPWVGAGGDVETHSGTAGFDHLEHYEAEMAASTVIGGGVARLSVVTRPVLLQAGVPDSTSNYRFASGGALPTDTQFASGTGGSLQLDTKNLQASVGFSPTGFPVDNVLGSVAWRPRSGPFTFSFYRASQKDSLLSYAGMKDPATGEVWGGVVATGGAFGITHGTAGAGYYASIDGQRLTGVNVVSNTRLMGNVGAYWLVYSNRYGDLKAGANVTAMHYDLNERYFTIGQGGYFSPNAFLLMNAPVSWEGRSFRNTVYQISGSLGAQSIQEAAALPGSLVLGTGVVNTTGASYDLHLKVAHRIDAHWVVEGFYDTNNARSYKDDSAGFTVRYTTYPQPAESAPSGFVNLSDPLPLQVP